jgi:hypothetical protein
MIETLVLNGSPDDRGEQQGHGPKAEMFAGAVHPLGVLTVESVNRGMRRNLGVAGLTQQIPFEQFRIAHAETPVLLPPV